MIRYKVSKNMRVLFVGINPSPGTYQRGIPFSNNKTFWYLLNRAGLIDEKDSDLKDDVRLKRIYNSKFNVVYKFGLLNIINRPTVDVSKLKRGEEKKGRKKIFLIIRTYRPPIVCFIGKITYEKFSGLKCVRFGWQDDIYESKIFVMHFPLHGKASVRIRELQEIIK
ncbi:MAG TPA: mismatch-specific DNA-glycosylase [Candidatus Nitrosotenuis sp.]|nr:mismatch-specific DNA-glycosylase [Candidatus Nitrosotenuis sp.]